MNQSSRFLLAVILLSCPVWLLQASNSTSETSTFDGVEVVHLPAWREGECRESFDVRIWPEETVLWLERENLRDLIADPATPQQEREELKRVLALQRAWLSS